MKKTHSLSVCMIDKNEEKILEDCLKSVLPVADEIIVVDNGSSDNSLSILKNYGCKIIDGSQFYVDEARNLYLNAAKSEWILIIDADERLDENSYGLIEKTLEKTDEKVYGIQLKNIQYLGKGLWCEVPALRIIRNHKGIKYDNVPIHASLGTSITKMGKKIINSDILLHHIDILINNRAEKKREKYRKGLETILFSKNKIIDERYYLNMGFYAMEYIAIQEYDKAEDILLKALQKEIKFKPFLMVFLCQLYIITNNFQKLEKLIKSINFNMQNLLDSADIIGNYYCYLDKNLCREYYMKQCIINPSKISNYLNLAYLMREKDTTFAKKLIETAFEKNSYLKNPLIYKEGDECNIFKQQSNFIFPIKDLKCNLFLEI